VIPEIHFVHQICTLYLHLLYFTFTNKVLQYTKPITLKLHGIHITKSLNTLIMRQCINKHPMGCEAQLA